MKTKSVGKLDSFEHIRWYSSTKADQYSSCSVVIINTVQLHPTKTELKFYAGSNSACSVSKIRHSEDLPQWSRLEVRLNTFRPSTIPQKQFIIIIIFSYPCRSRWFIFKKQIIVLFWVIIYSCLERFFKIGVPGTLYTIHRKTTVPESFFNHPVACLFFNKRLRHRPFLVDIAKMLRTPFLQEHLETPDSVFIGYICNYNIIKFNVN